MAAKPAADEAVNPRKPAKPLMPRRFLLTDIQTTEFRDTLWIAILINLKEWS
jgi:hypothetical protein